MKTHYRTCNICEALCGIEIKYEGEKIISIKGDKKDPLSRGHICPKAVALQDFYQDENRIRQPLKKSGSGFVEISWDEAFEITVEQIKSLQKQYGVDAVGVYLGNPNAHNLGNQLFIRQFFKALKTKNRFSASSVDQLPHHVASQYMFGHTLLNPVPDLDRTNYLLIIGGNPIVSNGSMMSSPDFGKRLRSIQDRNGKVVVVDPRYTETSRKADEHIYIRPETDAVLLLAMINVLYSHNKVRLNHLEDNIVGVDQLKSVVSKYTTIYAENVTGIPSEKIVSMTLEMVEADKAVLYSRMGLSTQKFGGLCLWLTNVFNILNGNFDREGGMMFARPAIDPVFLSPKKGKPEWKNIPLSRVRKLPKYLGEVPSASMSEEIETEGEGQIKAMIVIAGNPILSTPNGKRLEKAFKTLDFVVCSDIYITETSKHADIILPAASGLEVPQYDITFLNLAIHNMAKYSPPLYPKKGNVKHDWEILSELTAKLNDEESNGQTPEMMLEFLLQMGPYAKEGLNMDRLKANPHGVDLGPLRPCLMERLQTNDNTIRLAPQLFIDDLNRLDEAMQDDDKDESFPFKMIGRRVLRHHNTWTHNSHRLSRGPNECTLLLNAKDAERLSIKTGDFVNVKSRVGNVNVEVEVTSKIMESVVCLPQGFGTSKKSNMKIAADRNSVSINDLTDEMRVDTLTGNAALNGVRVDIEKTD